MRTVAYLRVSTVEQDTEKNKNDILKFANDKKLSNVDFIEETVTGTKSYKERKLGLILNELKSGDILIIPELSRLARSISQIIEIIELTKRENITLYSIKESFCNNDDTMTSTITSTVFALVAQLERDLIRLRTKEALQAKKAQGIKLGRPKGKGKSKFDEFRTEIENMISMGVPKTVIARKYNSSVQNLYHWLKNINSQ